MGSPVRAAHAGSEILADVEISNADCSGVIFAHGSRFGGHSLFIKDRKLFYVYNFLGIKPEQKFIYDRASVAGKLDRGLDEAPKRGWTWVSMKNDWKTVFLSQEPRKEPQI